MTAQEIVEQERRRPAAFQQRAHHPEIPARAYRIAERKVITDADRHEEEGVEVGEDRWLGGRDAGQGGHAISLNTMWKSGNLKCGNLFRFPHFQISTFPNLLQLLQVSGKRQRLVLRDQ